VQEQQGGARSPVGISHALDVSGGVYSESDTYSSQLLWRGRGFPLYVPGPQETLPQEYRQRGVTIGDVGSVTPEGIFDFLFNIYLSADNCINANYVPEGFSPLTPDYDPRDVVHHGYAAGEYVATSSVRKLPDHQPMARYGYSKWHAKSLRLPDRFLSQPPSEDSIFHCKPPKGAVLAMPFGSRLEKLRNLESMRRYAAANADSWYKYANGPRGRGLTNGSLYLVTGCEKSRSWGMAAF
ncbi:hypothetical protein B0H11DRAFT_2433262, partial [Mycena galericulata]